MKRFISKNIGSDSGFTLIEILIVVAIIAILSSVVLVGLGPTQQSGRDARRLSDLHEIQTGLELYYSKCGFYPGGIDCAPNENPLGYSGMSAALTGSGIGVTSVPQDPTKGASYSYATNGSASAGGSSYLLMAKLENQNNSAFVNYTAPSTTQYTYGDTISSCSAPNYCITL